MDWPNRLQNDSSSGGWGKSDAADTLYRKVLSLPRSHCKTEQKRGDVRSVLPLSAPPLPWALLPG